MFIHFTLHDVTPVRTFENFLDSTVEVYQTWLMTRLEPLIADPKSVLAAEQQKAELARTGYSVRGAPDDGVSLRAPGSAMLVLDPQISFELPEDAIEKDRRYLFRLQFFWWESDNGTEKVRATFADPTLQVLVAALKATNEDAVAAKAVATKWLDENWKKILDAGAVAAGVGANPWISVGLQLLPGVEALLKMALNHGDTLLDRHAFVMSTVGTGTSIEWHVIPPSGEAGKRITGIGTQSFDDVLVREGSGHTELKGSYVFRIMD
jgi:hypothetical protein